MSISKNELNLLKAIRQKSQSEHGKDTNIIEIDNKVFNSVDSSSDLYDVARELIKKGYLKLPLNANKLQNQIPTNVGLTQTAISSLDGEKKKHWTRKTFAYIMNKTISAVIAFLVGAGCTWLWMR